MLRTKIRTAIISAVSLLIVVPARAADEKRIRQAIDRAVAYLKGNYKFDQDAVAWPPSKRGVLDKGIALCGVALLEAKVPVKDPIILDIARVVRSASIDEDRTSYLAWDVIFLDKLGDPEDIILIQSMAARLIMGQNRAGGWSDFAPALDKAETKRMRAYLTAVAADGAMGVVAPRLNYPRPRLDPIVREMLEGKHITQIPDSSSNDDNFNTQFAILAVWAARKYGAPAEALDRVQIRFRATQFPDGGWAYAGSGPARTPTPAMTCAGLLGLTVNNGFQRERIIKFRDPNNPLKESSKEIRRPPPDPRIDPQIQKAIGLLAQTIYNNRFGEVRDDLYRLWSLESVAVVLEIYSFGGGRKWFDWGCDWLLTNQNADGSFTGKWGKRADTSFALLFLLRANLMRDLTHLLKSNRVVDVVEAPEPPPAPPEKPKEAPSPQTIVTPVPCQPQCQPCPCDCCQPTRRPGICGFLFRRRR